MPGTTRRRSLPGRELPGVGREFGRVGSLPDRLDDPHERARHVGHDQQFGALGEVVDEVLQQVGAVVLVLLRAVSRALEEDAVLLVPEGDPAAGAVHEDVRVVRVFGAQGGGDGDRDAVRGADADARGVVGLDVVGAQQLGLDAGDVLGAGAAAEGESGGDGVRERVGEGAVDDVHTVQPALARPRARAGSTPRRAPTRPPRRCRSRCRWRPRRSVPGSRAGRASPATGTRSGRRPRPPRPRRPSGGTPRTTAPAASPAAGARPWRRRSARGRCGWGSVCRSRRRRRRWSRGARRSRRTARARRGRPAPRRSAGSARRHPPAVPAPCPGAGGCSRDASGRGRALPRAPPEPG